MLSPEYLRQITEGSEQSINRNIVECKDISYGF